MNTKVFVVDNDRVSTPLVRSILDAKEMLEAIQKDLTVTFKEYHEKGEAYLLVATSADEETTQNWIAEVKETFPGMEVLAGNLSLEICCHTGEGVLGVGISCRPKR